MGLPHPTPGGYSLRVQPVQPGVVSRRNEALLTENNKASKENTHVFTQGLPTPRARLNWSNAEGRGSMHHGEIITVAYRAPAAQDCNPAFPLHSLAVKMCNFKRNFLKCCVPWLRFGYHDCPFFVINVLWLLTIRAWCTNCYQ